MHQSAILKAYKRLAMKFHPDRNQGDDSAADKFKEVKVAYEILTDAQKAAYDQYGHAAFEQGGMGNGSGYGGGGKSSAISSVMCLAISLAAVVVAAINAVFMVLIYVTTWRKHRRSIRVVSKEIEVPTLVECDTCDGSGAKAGSSAQTCGTCHGHGQVQMRQGFFAVQQTCPTCNGKSQDHQRPM